MFLNWEKSLPGIRSARMKTGTPPRIDVRSLDLDKMLRQKGDENPERFSFLDVPSAVQSGGVQMDCFLLHTNDTVHEILKSGFDKSPNTEELYLQGFSSSLPLEVQLEAMRHIEGLEKAVVFKPAYAVEYDYFDPQYLHHSLRSKIVDNLFLAGQVNGTTGYEEAACQGLMAGVNAHLYLQEKDPFVLSRDQAYIGVLIDDLINKGVDEPYRMFTSRAEYRILLRQDNADFRLTALSHSLGLASEERYSLMMRKQEDVEALSSAVSRVKLRAEVANPVLESLGSTPLSESKRLVDIVSRPEVSLSDFIQFVPRGTYSEDVVAAVEIGIKYSGYIEREKSQADKNRRLEYIRIPSDFDFDSLQGLSIECRQKLKRYKPETIAQASRISGVSPSDISVLLVYFGR